MPAKEWMVTGALLLITLFGGAFAYGRLNEHMDNLTSLEQSTEKRLMHVENKVDLIAERVARIEGYLEKSVAQTGDK